ncbi:MAG: beta-1,6-N-acetylglucosaminyltransferase [Pseudomonadota bacterium]
MDLPELTFDPPAGPEPKSAPLGFVMLVHKDFHRVEQVARHWAAAGCPVVIHVDRNAHISDFQNLVSAVHDEPRIEFAERHRCDWGAWGIVAGTQAAARQLLNHYPDVRHVYLASGSCLPLRPVEELIEYLAERPRTDFIESATTSDVPWTIGGLDDERFTLRFPFSWKKQRRLFDRYVRLQRRLKLKRTIPDGIVPHMGSQWWCLTRRTLSAILEDKNRRRYERYFSKVWIPDESYFQTLCRLYSTDVQSRSLTLSKFDFHGKPHIFYDDHLQLLRRSDCFVARKIWPRADLLYNSFLTDTEHAMKKAEPNRGKIDRVFARAAELRTHGRPGLYMQSRFPADQWREGRTCTAYSVFEGFSDVFVDWEDWLARNTDARVHGHLFAENWVQFSGREKSFAGALSDSAELRDDNSRGFLTNLLWNTRGEHQCFQFGPWDSQYIQWDLAKDPNARIYVITGAWALQHFRSNADFADIRRDAAWRQKIEAEHLNALKSTWARGKTRILSMTEFMENPMEHLQTIIDDIVGEGARRLIEAPRMHDLTGFGRFLQTLKNEGMHPYLLGDYPIDDMPLRPRQSMRRPYLVKK